MAKFGAKHPCFKADDKSAGVVLGKLVSANLTVNLASGELYADDGLDEQLSEFSSGSIALELNDLTDANAVELYGCTASNGVVTYNIGDTAPRGGFAHYRVLMRSGVKYFEGRYFPRVRAALGNENDQTRGNSITFQTVNTTLTVFADDNGDWKKTQVFDDEQDAIDWVEEMCAVST